MDGYNGPTSFIRGAGTVVTILVVEDDQQILALIDRLLGKRGHTVIAAPDPDDALVALSEHKATPDLLLSDIILADRRGVDFARVMREKFPALKVVFMTGWS